MKGSFDLLNRNPRGSPQDRVRIKICGINNQTDIEFCSQIGVDAVGFLVGQETLGPDGRVLGHWLSIERVASLVAAVPEYMSAVLLVHVTSTEEIVALCKAIRPHVIQVQEKEADSQVLQSVRRQLPTIKIIKTFHVTPQDIVTNVLSTISSFVEFGILDGILLDSKRGTQTGGTGHTHDWNISAAVVAAIPDMPVILAGGLKAANLKGALALVKPYAVDIMTGAESARGVKDHKAISDIVNAASSIA